MAQGYEKAHGVLGIPTMLAYPDDQYSRRPFMSKPLLAPLLILAVALGIYADWAVQRPQGHYLTDLRSPQIGDQSMRQLGPNLLAILPELSPSDYQSPAHLHRKLSVILDTAKAAGRLKQNTVVILPDHIGTWLVLSGERAEVYNPKDARKALRLMVLSNPSQLIATWLHSDGFPNVGETLLRMKAPAMARDYFQLFSSLARDYRITLQAGSLILPTPHWENGELRSGHGSLYNIALTFNPNGDLLGQPYQEPWPSAPTRVGTLGEAAAPRLFLRSSLWPPKSLIGEATVQSFSESEKENDTTPGSHPVNLELTTRSNPEKPQTPTCR